MSCFRNLLHALCHFVQLFQHRVLTRRDPMHPPKTNAPARDSDPGENGDQHFIVRKWLSRFTIPVSMLRTSIRALTEEFSGCSRSMSILPSNFLNFPCVVPRN